MVFHLESGQGIQKPVTPYEDLTANWTFDQRQKFIAKLKNLRDRGQDALDEEDAEIATGIWQKQFGKRFPIIKSIVKESVGGTALQTPTPVTIPAAPARSA